MKKHFPYLIIWVLIGLFLLSSSAFASHVVTYFRDNKRAAVSISFDDGNQSPVTNGVPQLNARNIREHSFHKLHLASCHSKPCVNLQAKVMKLVAIR